MRASFPIEGMSGGAIRDLLKNSEDARGSYPIGANRLWHGGLHIPTSGDWASKPVVAMADGKVIAYRITDDYLKYGDLEYSNSFVLIEHEYRTPYDDGAGNPKFKLRFYSLYMHLLPISQYTTEMKKRLPTVLAARKVVEKVDDKAAAIALRTSPPQSSVITTVQVGEIVVSTQTQKRNVVVAPNGAPTYSQWQNENAIQMGSELSVTYRDLNGEEHTGWVKKSKLKKLPVDVTTDPTPPDAVVQRREIRTQWQVIKTEGGVVSKGLRTHGGPSAGSPKKRVLPKGTIVEYEISERDYPWARLLEPAPSGGNEYFCLSTSKYEPTVQYSSDFKKARDLVFPRGLYVKAGEVIGYPGKYYGQPEIHVEVFTAEDMPALQAAGAAIATPFLQAARVEVAAGKPYSTAATGAPEQALSEPLIVDCISTADGSKNDLIRDKAGNKLKIWNGSASIWVKEVDVTRRSALAWPGFHFVDSGATQGGGATTDAFYDLGEGDAFFSNVFNIVDENHDKTWSAVELKNAAADDKKYHALKGLVCRHPSEWQTDDGMSKWQKLNQWISNSDELRKTKDLIKSLTWWDQVAARCNGFPTSPIVWHFHPVAFVENYFLLPEEEVSFFIKTGDGRKEVFTPTLDNVGPSNKIYYQTIENTEFLLGSIVSFPTPGKTVAGSNTTIVYKGLANGKEADWGPSLYEILNKADHAAYTNGVALGDRDKRVWTGITDNEGNMRALNQYDNAFLSAGPFQQTCGVTRCRVRPDNTLLHTLDVRGELQGAANAINNSKPNLFAKHLGKYGLSSGDVHTECGVLKGRFFLQGQPIVLGDKDEFRRFAWSYRFFKALKNIDFCSEFLRHGFTRLAYIRGLTRQISWAYTPVPVTLGATPAPVSFSKSFKVEDVFKSDLALALILDTHINLPSAAEGPNHKSVWARAIRDYLQESKAQDLVMNDLTEWKLIRKIIANRAASKMTAPGLRTAKILRYVKRTDLVAMAEGLEIATDSAADLLATLVEEPEGFGISAPVDAGLIVEMHHVDILSAKRT